MYKSVDSLTELIKNTKKKSSSVARGDGILNMMTGRKAQSVTVSSAEADHQVVKKCRRRSVQITSTGDNKNGTDKH